MRTTSRFLKWAVVCLGIQLFFVQQVVAQLPCNNWLQVPTMGSSATAGDLDVSGNQITVEATFNRTIPLYLGVWTGFLVSKHSDATDVNYSLFGNGCEITTSSGGYTLLLENCPFILNKVNHVAMVYDGTTVKFYRNGFLHAEQPCSGTMAQNAWPLTFGQRASSQSDIAQFQGIINEVRIWNVPRTQAQIRQYMNTALPNPTTQTGLLGYYQFDNLLNKQGNAAYNVQLGTDATINATNPNCSFIADTCPVRTSITNIINTYTPVVALNPCKNIITVEDGSTYNTGDTVLLIQMKGATIDSSASAAFGDVVNYGNAGNYEFNYVKSRSGNQVELLNVITRPYDIPNGKVQLIRVPYYNTAIVTSTLTCLPWDGSKGGVLAFNVKDSLLLQTDIDVTGKGFSGGQVINTRLNSTNCYTNNYFLPASSLLAAPKGESIALISNNISSGKGKLASAGGGGLDHNSGGGGGANGSGGGLGGYQLFECNSSFFDNRGIGGVGLTYNSVFNKVFLAGGGGAGHCNNGLPNSTLSNMNGGNGGGIVIISTNYISGNNHSIIARGDSAYELNSTGGEAHDGMGGGGGGGTVLLDANSFVTNTVIDVKGGKGGDMHAPTLGGHIGPGGGGGGGVVWLKQASIPGLITIVNDGGRNGVILLDNNNAFGATPGLPGINAFNLQIPVDQTPFKTNIDSVRIKDSQVVCNVFDFKGLGYTNTGAITQWDWNFGDGVSASGQNVSHTFSAIATYIVKLVVTDANGCKDSLTKTVIVNCIVPPSCRSSLSFRRATNSTAPIALINGATHSQLYNANGFTWDAWFRLTGPIINQSLLISTEDAVPFQDIFLGFGWGPTPNALSFVVSDNGTTNTTVAVESLQTFAVNNWYHVTAVCDYAASSIRLYLNGNLVGSTTIPASILNNRLSADRNVQIGNAQATLNGIDADMDEIRFWSTVRTPAQILASTTECTTLPQAGLVAYFKADERTGATTVDALGNGFLSVLQSVNWATQVPNINCSNLSIKDSATSCSSFDFKGISTLLNGAAISSWHWTFGDGASANSQDTAHTYSSPGTYTVTLTVTDVNGCIDSVRKDVTSFGAALDFSYKQDVCNPGSVQFSNAGIVPQNPVWDFGDGITDNTNNLNPIHVYADTGTYTVQFSAQNGSCLDTVVKTILVGIQQANIIATRDTTLCPGRNIRLSTTPALSFCWTPTTFLDNPTVQNPLSTPTQNITYYFTAEIPGTNLVTNGNFSAGNSGFTSDYTFAANNTLEGEYFVGPSPAAWNPGMAACRDHTNGNGNMLLLNGSPVVDAKLWNQTVTVTPNTNYAFTTWIQSLSQANPAQLSFSVNGSDMGALVTASLPTCTWTRFYTTWNSGNNTSATIAIVNKNTLALGNDFALDDIAFTPVTIRRDSLVIKVDSPLVTTGNDTTICEGNPVQLQASGSFGYTWSPVIGLSDSTISNPIATPADTTRYIVTGTTAAGCSAKDTITINVKPSPAIGLSADTAICRGGSVQLVVSGGDSYQWSPALYLDNPLSDTVIASPADTITYYVTATSSNLCSSTDSVHISFRTLGRFSITPSTDACFNTKERLVATGGNVYAWTPAASLDNASIPNPNATPRTTTTYTVKITDSVCNADTTLSTTLTILPLPKITITKSNDIDCNIVNAQLLATGGVNYTWRPNTYIDNDSIPNPLVYPRTTATYYVTVKDSFTRCTNTDSIIVFVKIPNLPEFYISNAFTPNNDTHNDCFHVDYVGTIRLFEMWIYNRLGNVVFHTTDPKDCWDGTYKGSPQDPGNFVYMIKASNTCLSSITKGNLLLIR